MANQIDQAMLEALVKIRPDLRTSQALIEYIADVVNRSLRTSQFAIEYISEPANNREIRTSQLIIEVIRGVPEVDVYLDEFCETESFAW